MLEAHEPADSHEADDLAAIKSLLAGMGSAALDRRTWAPGHITASGFVVSQDGSRLLLVFHTRLGRWLQPGGHLEQSDTSVEEAARREVAEEVGLEAVVPLGLLDVAVHDIREFGDEPPHRHFDIRFAFRITRGTPCPGPGVAAIKWIRLDEFDQQGVDQGVIRAAKKIEESSASMRASTTPGQ